MWDSLKVIILAGDTHQIHTESSEGEKAIGPPKRVPHPTHLFL